MFSFQAKPLIWLFLIVLVSIVLFSPAFFTFFSGDDFYNMRLVMGSSIWEVGKTFLFERNEAFLFYRPLTTQFYFFLTQPIFGFNPLGYHFISLTVFVLIILLVYKLAFVLTGQQFLALMATFFYAFSASNLTRLAWIVQIQELAFGLFALVCVYNWLIYQIKKQSKFYLISIFSFILALMSKETAVIIPFSLLLSDLLRAKLLINRVRKGRTLGIIPYLLVLLIYLYLRFFKIGISTGQHYFTSFSPKSIANTLFWYFLWAVGLPEELANFDLFSLGFKPNQEFINYLLNTIPLVTISFMLFVTIMGLMLIKLVRELWVIKRKERDFFWQLLLFSSSWFVLSLLPHLFSPWHKFAYELTVPLFGLSLGMATVVSFFKKGVLWKKNRVIYGYKSRRLMLLLLFISYFWLSISTIDFEKNTHWVFKRGRIAQKVFSYLQRYYPALPMGSKMVFINDQKARENLYGISKQIFLALSDKDALQLFYRYPDLEVYYQDIDADVLKLLEENEVIVIPSSQFIL